MLQVPHSHVKIKMNFSTHYLFVLNQACTCLNCTLFNLQFAKLSNHKARLVVFFFSFSSILNRSISAQHAVPGIIVYILEPGLAWAGLIWASSRQNLSSGFPSK